ncbi:MAG: hypothetical protein RR595_10565 [Lysinibacillus sp.]
MEGWIIEGAHHKWIEESLEASELIIFLDTPYRKRERRIFTRFLKQILLLEKSNYKPTWKILCNMYQWNTLFEFEIKKEITVQLLPYTHKVLFISNYKSVEAILKSVKR